VINEAWSDHDFSMRLYSSVKEYEYYNVPHKTCFTCAHCRLEYTPNDEKTAEISPKFDDKFFCDTDCLETYEYENG